MDIKYSKQFSAMVMVQDHELRNAADFGKSYLTLEQQDYYGKLFEKAEAMHEALENIVDDLNGLSCSSAPRYVVDGISRARGRARKILERGGS